MKKLFIALFLGSTAIAQAHQKQQELSPIRTLTLEILKSNHQLLSSLSQEDLKKIGNLSPLNSFAHLVQAMVNFNSSAFITNNPEDLRAEISKNPQILEMLIFQSLQASKTLNAQQFEAVLQEYTSNPNGEFAQTLKKQFQDNKDELIAQISEQQDFARAIAQEIISSQLHEYTKDLESIEQASLELSIAIKINGVVVDKTEKPLTFDVSPLLKDIKEKAQAEKLAAITKKSKNTEE